MRGDIIVVVIGDSPVLLSHSPPLFNILMLLLITHGAVWLINCQESGLDLLAWQKACQILVRALPWLQHP